MRMQLVYYNATFRTTAFSGNTGSQRLLVQIKLYIKKAIRYRNTAR